MVISRLLAVGLCASIGGACADGASRKTSETPPQAAATPTDAPSQAAVSEPEADAPPSTKAAEGTSTKAAEDGGGALAIAQTPPPEPKSNPYIAPPVRTEGDLTVHAPPKEPRDPGFVGRLRSHTEGSLTKGSPRTWVGPQVPGFVALLVDTMELFLLDRVGDEFVAFYREPYGAGGCDTGSGNNCRYMARLYDIDGKEQWSVMLHDLLSSSSQIEIQDMRYADGTLYFNEACQSYSSGAGGKCSALVAYDPVAKEVRWRTKHLVSNGRFLVHGDYVVTGYGFTSEKDFLYVVSRNDGSIMQQIPLRKSAETIEIADDGLLEVRIYPGTLKLFEMRGWDTAKPKLVKAKRKASGRETVTR